MQERRKYSRFNTKGSVILKTEDKASTSIKAELSNISFEGFSVHAAEKIEVDTNVRFELNINLWYEPISGEGKIKYIQEIKKPDQFFRMGVEFVKLDRKVIQHIISLIQAEICAETRRKEQFRRKAF